MLGLKNHIPAWAKKAGDGDSRRIAVVQQNVLYHLV
jgi:hypothetical protein